ncbi:hypothetical protein B9Z40_03520 [Limnohabitans sp. 15K]|nr:hypothetical protein B9Z40_03520 [Limnohabitans sp. 15K]
MASEFGILWKTGLNVIRWETTAPAVGIYPCGSDAPVAKSLVHRHLSPRGRGSHKNGAQYPCRSDALVAKVF